MGAQRYILNRQVVIRMIDDESRRALLRPRTLVRGVIRGYKPRGPLHFEFKAQDFLASLVGPASPEKQVPPEAITKAQFPACPVENVGKPVPIVYGALSGDAVISPTLTPPVITGHVEDGYYTTDTPMFGFGPTDSVATPPTSLVVTVNGAGSGAMSDGVQNSEYGFIVTAVDSQGRESDPLKFYWNGPGDGRGSFDFALPPVDSVHTATVPDGTRSITCSWSDATNAVKYRCYVGTYYYGARWTYYMEVDAPTTQVTFTKHPSFEVWNPSLSDITPGGNFIHWAQSWEYAVTAVGNDGESGMSLWGRGGWGCPYRRPIKIEWLAVTGATSYKVYRRGMFGAWDRYWYVPGGTLVFYDDLLDTNVHYITTTPVAIGVLEPTYVGVEADQYGAIWHSWLIAGHQIGGVTQVFQNNALVDSGHFGVDVLVPGQTGYTTYFAHSGTPPYKVVNGRKYSMMYARGPIGDSAAGLYTTGEPAEGGKLPFTINLNGRLNALNGTVITALTDIYKDFVINWGFQNCAGDYLSAPNWPTDLDDRIVSQIDTASFDTVKAVHDSRLSGGYPGAIAFGAEGEFLTLRDCIAQLNLSCDCQSGFNRNSQFFITILDDSPAILDTALEYTQMHDIIKASFDLEARTDQVENVIIYSYGRKYVRGTNESEWIGAQQELRDQTAIDNLRETRKSAELILWAVRVPAVAYDIAQRRLLYYKDPPMEVTVETNLRGLSTELGDIIKVTHIEGLSTTGYQLQPLRVLRHITNPSDYRVKLICVDVERYFGGSVTGGGPFILGDETALAASWATAPAGDRVYGYLADETTNEFSDGAEIKHLR